MSAVDWEFFLGRTLDKKIIEGMSAATSRSITVALNDRESAAFTLSLFEKAAPLIKTVSTCLVAYRNGVEVWSGPIWTARRDVTSKTVQCGCLGWYEFVNRYLLKTGTAAPTSMPSSTATSQQYVGVDQCSIAADMLSRGIADAQAHGAPTFVALGSVPSSTQPRNITYQEFKNVGQSITELAQIEAGFDFRVDPKTRLLNLYYDGIWPVGGPYTVQGRGRVRQNLVWGHHWGPANIEALTESEDASKLENDVYAVGQYGIGSGYEPASQAQYGLFSSQASLSDVTQTTILSAFAQAEATVNAQPLKIWSFDQMPLGKASDGEFTAYQPFGVDFDVGDFGYLKSDYALIVPTPGSALLTQPVRVFGYTVNISDDGIETVKNASTTYQGTA